MTGFEPQPPPDVSAPPHGGQPDPGPDVLQRVFEFSPDAGLLIGSRGIILRVNLQAERMFGYARRELVGHPVEILIPRRFSTRHIETRNGYLETPRIRPMGAGMELFARCRDGRELPVDIMLSPLVTGAAPVVLAVVRDISERKEAEQKSRLAREMFLREMHHRVKNNLQVIGSLLFLQSVEFPDPRLREALEESQSRVRAIALIHEKLYHSPGMARLDFGDYVRALVTDLLHACRLRADQVEIRTQVDDIPLEIESAVPCGLIINELVSNAFKHAWPSGARGTVTVELTRAGGGEYLLRVRDNGVGLPPGFDPGQSRTLGMRLVADLARQLDGRLEFEPGPGAGARLSFRPPDYAERS